jgi:transposase
LRKVIDWGQALRKSFERKDEKPARDALLKLMERANESTLEPPQDIAGTLRRWFEPIARSIRHRYTNGMTEGFNNYLKATTRVHGREYMSKRNTCIECPRSSQH